MKDAVGSSLLVYIVIIIVGIVGACVISSTAYSKAYKAKNNIVDIIEKDYLVKNDNIEDETFKDCLDDEGCKDSIKTTLEEMPYNMSGKISDCNNALKRKEKDYDENKYTLVYPEEDNEFNGYCIYKTFINGEDYYYTVITFSHLNIKVFGLGTLFKTPVFGQTRTYYGN